MKPNALAGVLLILLGVVALASTRASHMRAASTVVDIGPLYATAERQHTLPLSPLLGIAAVAGGAMLLYVGARKNA